MVTLFGMLRLFPPRANLVPYTLPNRSVDVAETPPNCNYS